MEKQQCDLCAAKQDLYFKISDLSIKHSQSPATYPELTFRLEVGACKSPIDQRAWRYAKQTLYAGSRPTAECFLSSALWKSKQQTSRRTVRNGFGQNAGV